MLLPKDTTLTGAINKRRTDVRSTAIEISNLCVADGDYIGAISSIQNVITEVGEDAELNSLNSKHVNSCKNFLISEANTVYHISGYEEAISLLKQGLDAIGTDEELTALISKYEAYDPTSFYT